ncbi:MAG TPA: hypothetical protein VF306_16185, partial [Pirellulales bacterium]
LMRATGAAAWMVAGLAWSVGLLLLGLVNDARYKAFIGRLKQLEGQVMVVGGGRQMPPFAPAGSAGPCARPLDATEASHKREDHLALSPKNVLVSVVHTARKFCEIHVVMNTLTAVAVAQLLAGGIALGKLYLAIAAPLALVTAVSTLARDIHRGAAEREFAQWYRALDDI